MKKLKYEILFTILFMTIGIAAVTSNLSIKGTTPIAANTDDFDVYFSDVKSVSDNTNVSLNTSKSFKFTTTLENLNQESEVSFKVTNASQNYDAEVSISCTGDTTYLKTTPHLSNSTVPARSEIDGNIKVKLIKTYTGNSTSKSITCTIDANAVEKDVLSNGIEYSEKLVMLKNYSTRDALGFISYKFDIKTITFDDEINIPEDAIETWDFGVAENGNVMAYIVANLDDSSLYDLYIQTNEQLYGNPDMSWWFADFYYLETINNIDLLDTSKVTDMSYMFGECNSLTALDLSSFDTSNVTNMSSMFASTNITDLDLSELETNKVTNMSSMFEGSSISSLDISGWDTSDVTNMSSVFAYSNITDLNISGWDTSNVTNMSYMFGYTSITDLDLTSFDTSNVTDMSYMFGCTNITDLDLNELETNKVTNMSSMFEGIRNTTLDLTDFDTSNVTNMSSMFASTNITDLDLSDFDTSNVTDMSSMFAYTNITDLDISGWDTSSVTDMSYMFYQAGYDNPDFNIDLSKLDTSSVTNMSRMFYEMGYNSTKLNTSITIKNPNVTSYSYMFKDVATKSGTSFTVNYTSETEELVDNMVATKTDDANVVKGTLIE